MISYNSRPHTQYFLGLACVCEGRTARTVHCYCRTPARLPACHHHTTCRTTPPASCLPPAPMPPPLLLPNRATARSSHCCRCATTHHTSRSSAVCKTLSERFSHSLRFSAVLGCRLTALHCLPLATFLSHARALLYTRLLTLTTALSPDRAFAPHGSLCTCILVLLRITHCTAPACTATCCKAAPACCRAAPYGSFCTCCGRLLGSSAPVLFFLLFHTAGPARACAPCPATYPCTALT